MQSKNMESTAAKIKDLSGAVEVRKLWKDEGKKVVFTNGCFDILHLGHIDYLEKSKMRGDKLVVGLNTSESISRIKGPGRPVNDDISRGRILAALEFVDLVVYFSEDTPYNLIKSLMPDVLVKGSDYLAENIVGADIVIEHGGEVCTINLVEGFSTSGIIDKIRKK